MANRQTSGIFSTYRKLQQKKCRRILVLVFLVVCAFLIDLSTGPANLGFDRLINTLWSSSSGNALHSTIIWHLRLPQTLMALMVGASLGFAGAEMQTLLDNPLASPFTLGISSAAALGAALTLTFNLSIPGIPTEFSLTLNALLLAILCTFFLDRIATRHSATPQSIVLFGIALIFSFNALLAFTQYLVDAAALQHLVFWMMGSLARSTPQGIGLITIVFVLTLSLSMRQAWQLTALRYGEDRALSLGINTRTLRRKSLFRLGVLTAVAVSLTGVIGFIGLVAPHIARRLLGEDHRWFLPASALTGAFLLLAAASVSKSLLSDTVLPVGIVTTLVGVPIFAWVVLRKLP